MGEKIIYLFSAGAVQVESHNLNLPKLGPVHFVDGEPEAQSGLGI